MKILIYGINFSPELTGIGKYSGEMAEWLSAQGHEVRVVTAPPYYPAWKVDAPYSAYRYQREHISLGTQSSVLSPASIDVWRCPLWVPGKVSGVKRLLHLASFALASLPVMLRQVFWRPEVVWMAAPALMCAPGAWFTARLSAATAVIHIQDFEVDAAFQLGLLRSPLACHFALWCERTLLRRFDIVSTISGRMVELAGAKGVSPSKVVFFPNWVDLGAISPVGSREWGVGSRTDHDAQPSAASSEIAGYRAELNIPAEAVVALYSGNMGMKQGLELLPEVARLCASAAATPDAQLPTPHSRLPAPPSVHFIFCGQGPGKALIDEACAGLPNVHLLPLQPMERLGELLTTADIHLLPQRADAADLVMPSKLTGMLASARPVVATAQPGTELARIVAGCGLVVMPEQPQAMADAVLQLAADAGLRQRLGAAGRAWAEHNLDRDAVLGRYLSRLRGS